MAELSSNFEGSHRSVPSACSWEGKLEPAAREQAGVSRVEVSDGRQDSGVNLPAHRHGSRVVIGARWQKRAGGRGAGPTKSTQVT